MVGDILKIMMKRRGDLRLEIIQGISGVENI